MNKFAFIVDFDKLFSLTASPSENIALFVQKD